MTRVKLTTRGRYAVMAMVGLAQGTDAKKPIPLSEIATHGDISLSYLEQLVAGLRRHGLVKSYRGPGGGYVLGKPANEIVVSEIFIAAEDSTPGRKKASNAGKSKKTDQTVELWEHIEGLLYSKLKDVTLADVVNNDLDDIVKPRKSVEI